jgi:hypothetical protein
MSGGRATVDARAGGEAAAVTLATSSIADDVRAQHDAGLDRRDEEAVSADLLTDLHDTAQVTDR